MNGDPEAVGVVHQDAPILTVGPSEVGDGVYVEIAELALTRRGEYVPDAPRAGNVTLSLTSDGAKQLAELLMKAANSGTDS